MTLQELSKTVNISESTLKNQFNRTKENLAKQGVIITKVGRGKNADYLVEYDELFNDNRALTIFEEEKKDIYLEDDMLKMLDWNLLVFVGICLTPLLTFRGSYEDFLKYAGLTPSAANVESLKNTLKEMDADYIGFYPDKTDDNYFTASIYRKVEKELKIPIVKLRKCREIQVNTHSRSFIPILKTWIATEKAIENQPYTIQDLVELTGLSASAVKRTNKLLKDAGVYKSQRDYDPEIGISKGVKSELNVFYNK